MMEKYREIFAREIAGSEVVAITDYLVQKEKTVATGEEKRYRKLKKLMLLNLAIQTKSWYTLRPSGTEPLLRVMAEAETDEICDV